MYVSHSSPPSLNSHTPHIPVRHEPFHNPQIMFFASSHALRTRAHTLNPRHSKKGRHKRQKFLCSSQPRPQKGMAASPSLLTTRAAKMTKLPHTHVTLTFRPITSAVNWRSARISLRLADVLSLSIKTDLGTLCPDSPHARPPIGCCLCWVPEAPCVVSKRLALPHASSTPPPPPLPPPQDQPKMSTTKQRSSGSVPEIVRVRKPTPEGQIQRG